MENVKIFAGRNITYAAAAQIKKEIRTPELTALGESEKGWIRQMKF